MQPKNLNHKTHSLFKGFNKVLVTKMDWMQGSKRPPRYRNNTFSFESLKGNKKNKITA